MWPYFGLVSFELPDKAKVYDFGECDDTYTYLPIILPVSFNFAPVKEFLVCVSCIVGAFRNILIHIHKQPDPKTICMSYKFNISSVQESKPWYAALQPIAQPLRQPSPYQVLFYHIGMSSSV